MAEIRILGVSMGKSDYTVHVALVTPEKGVDGDVDTVLGEAFVPFPEGAEMADVKDKIVEASKGILDRHNDAVDKTHDVKELEFPPIV